VRGDVSKGILEDCLPVTFVGAHGVEEGAAGGVAGLDHWGNTIQAVWVDFAAQVPSPGALAADYPFIPLDPSKWSDVVNLVPTVDAAVTAVESQLVAHFRTCPTTRFVLVGFSLGAWIIDKMLRDLRNEHGVRGQVFAAIAAVGAMGDPAFPEHQCKDVAGPYQLCRQGAATRFGQGYKTAEEYLDNGLPPDRFISLCLSYPPYDDTDLDGICGAYDPALMGSESSIRIHNEYDDVGWTSLVADFVAQHVR